jgi:hypothetical protein
MRRGSHELSSIVHVLGLSLVLELINRHASTLFGNFVARLYLITTIALGSFLLHSLPIRQATSTANVD